MAARSGERRVNVLFFSGCTCLGTIVYYAEEYCVQDSEEFCLGRATGVVVSDNDSVLQFTQSCLVWLCRKRLGEAGNDEMALVPWLAANWRV